MNKEIVIGFLNEHTIKCSYHDVSNCFKTDKVCTLCYNINRDISLLITRFHGARRTVDVGIALSPNAETSPYEPYRTAGFQVFHQRGETEAERIKSILAETFKKEYESTIIISHSVPNLPISYLEYAISDLRRGNNLVLGPTDNGMFYLIGVRRELFEKVRSDSQFGSVGFTNRTLRESTLKQIKSHYIGYGCSILPNWYILRTIDDLKKLYRDSKRGIGWKAQWTHLIADEFLEG
jgi:hypothetical protein